LGGDCGQESYHASGVDGCCGNRIDRLRFEDGDGVDRAATTAGLYTSAATGTLCGPSRTDAEVRLEETAGAQGAAPCATAREKDDPSIWQPNQCLRSAEPDLRHSRGGASISQPDCAAIKIAPDPTNISAFFAGKRDADREPTSLFHVANRIGSTP
jgi:hypothetical protein